GHDSCQRGQHLRVTVHTRFFFSSRRRHTRFSRDWSSDVCSSDLYPLRGRGVRIPTIDEVLEALPTMRITVEVKTGAAQRPLFDALDAAGARDRIILASAYDRDRTLFHEWKGALSASVEHGRRFYTLHRLHCARFGSLSAHVVQMPETWDGRRIVTPRFIRDVH